RGLLQLVKQPSSLKDEAGGPLVMVAATNQAVKEGVVQVIILSCLLSISVGIFNLLPFPPLDGGQMVMAFAELIRGGRRLSVQVQQAIMSTGLILVLALVAVVFFFDFQRFTGSPSGAPQNAAPSAVKK